MVTASGMPEREADLYRLITAVPHFPDPSIQPGLEPKHRVGRVVKPAAARRRREGSTSCLLPSSRFMLREPLVPSARYLAGAEGLAVQGIDLHLTTGDRALALTDSQHLHFAGNAFCGGSCAMIMLCALTFLNPSRL